MLIDQDPLEKIEDIFENDEQTAGDDSARPQILSPVNHDVYIEPHYMFQMDVYEATNVITGEYSISVQCGSQLNNVFNLIYC